MNHDCMGVFFVVDNVRYYCCFLDSKILTGAEEGSPCPHCNRIVNAQEAGQLRTETVTTTYVTIPGRGKVEFVPNGQN